MAAPVVMVVWEAGQVAVSSTAASWACLHSLNLLRHEVFRPCTLSISVLASQELRSDFMANASVQHVQSSLVLQPSTLVWNVSILVLQSPETDASMVMSAQLSSMLVLQFFKVAPDAEADLALEVQTGAEMSPPTAASRMMASLTNPSFFSFFLRTILAQFSALLSCLK